eukprot:TRINITY_DN15993_c0_g1_i1.p3 TRINITY_DN15993_c0_g1~~TRINITY_DN15993_c0_g1_i1.p3  ORF type:complete len:105 (+),score=18.50 TRINITY_DN15993_c0_g1_i1:62-376(+)
MCIRDRYESRIQKEISFYSMLSNNEGCENFSIFQNSLLVDQPYTSIFQNQNFLHQQTTQSYLVMVMQAGQFTLEDARRYRKALRLPWTQSQICLLYTSPSPRDS